MPQSVLLWVLLRIVLGAPYFLNETQTEVSEIDYMGSSEMALPEEEKDESEDYEEVYERDYGDDYEEDYEKDLGDDTIEVTLFLRNQSGLMTKEKSSVILKDEYENFTKAYYLEGMEGFPLENFSCIVYNHQHLRCSWAALNLPTNAQSTLTIRQSNQNTTIWNCPRNTDGKVVTCQAIINYESSYMTLHINVSLPDLWYIHYQVYDIKNIEKLNPPQNITMSVVSKNILIKWEPPSSIDNLCFHYQLNINNNSEVIEITGEREYAIPGVDLKKKYSVQMRVTKTPFCRINYIWSDWSDVLVLYPSKKPPEMSTVLIVIMAFGIPMCLLTILLLCNHRICEKLFPPVPGPSRKIKILLEREDCLWKQEQTHSKENKEDMMARW